MFQEGTAEHHSLAISLAIPFFPVPLEEHVFREELALVSLSLQTVLFPPLEAPHFHLHPQTLPRSSLPRVQLNPVPVQFSETHLFLLHYQMFSGDLETISIPFLIKQLVHLPIHCSSQPLDIKRFLMARSFLHSLPPQGL